MSPPDQNPSSIKALQDWIAEQNALASIDFVYFLLVPLTTFVLSQVPQLKEPEVARILSQIFVASSIPSLLVGVHGKMTDSVTSRIRAWGIFTWLFFTWSAMTALALVTRWLLPSLYSSVARTSDLSCSLLIESAANSAFTLSSVTLGSAMASYWMRKIWNIFLYRVPSRKPEVAKALDILVLKLLKPGMRRTYKEDLLVSVIGLLLYLAFLLIRWFWSI